MGRQADKAGKIREIRLAGRQTDRKVGRQVAGRQSSRQTGRPAGRQINWQRLANCLSGRKTDKLGERLANCRVGKQTY